MKNLATKNDIALTQKDFDAKFKEFELRMTIKMGIMLLVFVGLILGGSRYLL